MQDILVVTYNLDEGLSSYGEIDVDSKHFWCSVTSMHQRLVESYHIFLKGNASLSLLGSNEAILFISSFRHVWNHGEYIYKAYLVKVVGCRCIGVDQTSSLSEVYVFRSENIAEKIPQLEFPNLKAKCCFKCC